ncbi:MAG: YfhO family protein, partial [Acidobacteriota bacterium]|nr:YfhO family protein [Acidobacteriota bacterium]
LLWRGSTRRRTEVALALPLAIGLAVAIGLWPFVELFGHVPGLKMMFPLRFLSWVSIFGAALAAFGLDRWRFALERDRRAASAPSPRWGEGWGEGAIRGLLVALALAAFAVLVYFRFRDRHVAAGGLGSQREALVFALTALGVFALLGAAPRRAAVFAVVLAAAELVYQGTRLYRFGKTGDLAPPTPLLQFLGRQPGTFRIVGDGAVLFPNSNVFAGLEDVRTHDPIERREYIEFLDAAAGYRPAEYFKSLENLDAPAFDYLNVGYFVSAPRREPPGQRWHAVYSGADGTVFQNRSALPRVFSPARIEAAPSARAAASPRRADWGERALVAPSEWRGRTRPAAGPNGSAAVSRYRESANAVRFHAAVPDGRPALIATSIVDDGGWGARGEARATVSVGRANGPFLALVLPPGEHDVVLRYTAPGFRLGASVSVVALVALAVALAAGRRSHA